MIRKGTPQRNEVVICRVKRIYPNSVTADIVEYGITGMIHVSEVASRWVRNIREFLKENQYVICRVVDVHGDNIQLSVKRVRYEERTAKMNEFKRERKAEKLMELVAKRMKKSLEEAYNEVGFRLQDEFGSLSRAFDFAYRKPELLKDKGIPGAWAEAMADIAKKNYYEKTYRVVANLDMRCYSPDGVKRIKGALSKASDQGLEVKYISAPRYMVIGKGKNIRDVKDRIAKALNEIKKEISCHRGVCEFQIRED